MDTDDDLSRFEKEVLDCLSPVEWKTLGDLSKEIGKKRKIAGRRKFALMIFSLIDKEFAEEEVLNANVGSLIVALEKFQSLGWVEFRWRWRTETPEKTAARRGYRFGERRLTETGHRKRAALPQSAGEMHGKPAPQQS